MNAAQLVKAIQYEAEDAGLDTETIDASIDLAAILHARQTRRTRGRFTDTPYIEHPLRNTLRLLRAGNRDEDILVATTLHDVIEDGAQNFLEAFYGVDEAPEGVAREQLSQYIEDEFGPEPLRLVEAVTNDFVEDTEPSPHRTVDEKNANYQQFVRESVADDPAVLLVKLTDFIDNAAGLHASDRPGLEGQTGRQAAKYLPLVPIFRRELRGARGLLSPEGYASLMDKLDVTERRLGGLVAKYSHVR